MKIWLSKNSEIPVREQLVAQITLGIVSGDLPTGEKIPSTREIARRFQIHANTVASAYQKLVEKNLIEFKKGSGFYVLDAKAESGDDDGKPNLDALAAEFFRAAQSLGFSREEIYASVRKRFENKKPARILIVEPDADLRRIIIEEIKAATGCAVSGSDYEDLERHRADDLTVAAMADERQKLETVLSIAAPRVYLAARSVSNSMSGETRPEPSHLIAVASGWENFLLLAKTVLVAAQIDADSIVARSTKETGWRKGLENAALVICDALTAKEFDARDRRIRPFRLVADDSLDELKKAVT